VLVACSVRGRKAAIQATNKIGGRVLEVGVGTGIVAAICAAFAHLRHRISEAMLQRPGSVDNCA
jgi:phosphatidylethanolamine/phosphatidyl-N-methylethanolamine N-methyltransferase